MKKVLRKCVIFHRYNNKTININQSPYKEFRLDPPQIPFRYVMIDYMGPFLTKINGSKTKVWILVISCLWSRAINLKICTYLTTSEQLRAMQLHSYEWGVPCYIISDPGSQLVAGSNILNDFLNDVSTKRTLKKML